jgi:hypothetical protein
MYRLDGYSVSLSITAISVRTHGSASRQRVPRRGHRGPLGRTALMLAALALPLLVTRGGRNFLDGLASWALQAESPSRALEGRHVGSPALPGVTDKE